MRGNFEACFTELLKHEGGFSNHNSDPGGITNLGVTKKTWDEWTGKDNSVDDMKALTPEIVRPLYANRFWDACRCDDLPGGVDYCVFDTAVNSGKVRAIKFLQSVVGAVPDGAIGPVTIASVNEKGPRLVIEQFCDKREAFWRSLPTFSTFGKGWLRRGIEVRAKALEMV
jgi:lysozyme family protein